jgi:hypothetical protein
MYLRYPIDNSLTSNDEGMKTLLTWFLNEAMEQEAESPAGALASGHRADLPRVCIPR